MTKKAFDEDASQREISRLKKELAFVQMQVYNNKRLQNSNRDAAPSGDMKMAQAMQDQKKALEAENESLRQRIGQLEIDQEVAYNDRSMKGQQIMGQYQDEKSYLSSEIM